MSQSFRKYYIPITACAVLQHMQLALLAALSSGEPLAPAVVPLIQKRNTPARQEEGLNRAEPGRQEMLAVTLPPI